ncbi:MAG TPA: hypothetical protein VGW38_26930, partial [Chloroflexota bacterium]|nr:hypothetical protein [Chloroflexota bacterium]
MPHQSRIQLGLSTYSYWHFRDPKTPIETVIDRASALGELIKRGATMEEIARVRDPIAKTPAEAVYALKAGNARFYGGSRSGPNCRPTSG